MSRILIIDDDPRLLREAVHVLSKAGHDVIQASTPQTGIERSVSDKPALILLDIIMPGMDGICVLRTIRQNPLSAGIPIIILSSLATPEHQSVYFEEGAVDFLSKPISHKTLSTRVTSALSRQVVQDVHAAPQPAPAPAPAAVAPVAPVAPVAQQPLQPAPMAQPQPVPMAAPQPAPMAQPQPMVAPQPPPMVQPQPAPMAAPQPFPQAVHHSPPMAQSTVQRVDSPAVPQTPKGTVVGVLGVKGGCGASTLALNVAMLLAIEQRSVILAEIRTTYGSLSTQLGASPPMNLEQLSMMPLDSPHTVDQAIVRGGNGLRILFGPQGDYLKNFTSDTCEQLMDAVQSLAEITVVDLQSGLSSVNKSVLARCSKVLLVTEDDPVSIEMAAQVTDQLQRQMIPHAIKGVICRCSTQSSSVSIDQIRDQLQCDVTAVIPPSREVLEFAHRHGKTIAEMDPMSECVMAYKDICNKELSDSGQEIQFPAQRPVTV